MSRTTHRLRTTGAGKVRGREATAQFQSWKAAVLQQIQEGTTARIQATLAELQASGDLIATTEDHEPDNEDLENAVAMDCEIDLGDEDERDCDGESADSVEFKALSLKAGESVFTTEDAEESAFSFRLRVHEQRCFVVAPHLGDLRALTQTGAEALRAFEERYGLIRAVAEWLERERPNFLSHPDPIELGINAFKEMEQGLPSVSPSCFLQLSKIDQAINHLKGCEQKQTTIESFFSRSVEASVLDWGKDGMLSLKSLFDLDARKAWVACAVLQAAERLGRTLKKEELRNCKITVPRSSQENKRLATTSIDGLSFEDIIRRANQMVGTKWSEVVDEFLLSRI